MTDIILFSFLNIYLFIFFYFFSKRTFDLLKLQYQLIEGIILGVCVLVFILQFFHLFRPIDEVVVYCCFLYVFIEIIINSKMLYRKCMTHWKEITLCYFMFCLFVSNSFGIPSNGDSGAYHIPSINWIREYSVINGLGNFQELLGLNNSIFLLFAFFEFDSQGFSAHHVMATFLKSLYVLSVYFVYKKRHNYTRFYLYWVFLTFPAMLYYIFVLIDFVSPSPDNILFIIKYFSIDQMMMLWSNGDKMNERNFIFFTIVLSFCLVVKLSSAFFVVFVYIWLLNSYFKSFFRNKINMITAFCFCSLCVWLYRGYLCTGYLLFPIKVSAFDVVWKVDSELHNLIGAWAKYMGPPDSLTPNFWEWFPVWLEKCRRRVLELWMPLSVVLLCFPYLFKCKLFKLKIPLLLFISISAWFFTAPDPRFAYQFLLSLPVVILVHLFNNIENNKKYLHGLSLLWFTLFLVAFLKNIPSLDFYSQAQPLPTFKGEAINYKLSSGNSILVYVSNTGELWDAPLPCTTNIKEGLSLLGSDIKDGFYISKNKK